MVLIDDGFIRISLASKDAELKIEALLGGIWHDVSEEQANFAAKAMAKVLFEKTVCPDCSGDGFYARPDRNGEPEKCQCERCNMTGRV